MAATMRVAVLGLGLIGGSIARALHARPGGEWSVAAWTPQGSGPRLAGEAGIIELAAASPELAIDGADIVILAAPPLETLGLLRDLGGPLRRFLPADAVITDVASTKAAIVALATELDLRFVGGHPMAGREVAGFEASDAGLFADRPWVVIPTADKAAMAGVEAIANACGARVLHLSADDHDRAVAAISHLPMVLSASLVEAVAGSPDHGRADWSVASSLAAGGWESMTRLARGDVEMGTGIALTNAVEVAARLRDVRDVIDGWI
ncbi:MAG TPA: prephenate dehydrogenase/arogenate dehydrogenase family protein, partial [Candidatus Limnocylindrales bacterium]